MLKKYNILIFILLLANNLMADDDIHKLIKDSTKYSKFNIHGGVGLLNGTRLGINYRFNRNFSINVDYGVSTYIFFGAYASVFNTDLNYHFNNNGLLVGPSITLWKWGVNYRPEYAYIPSLNVGYIFYNPAKSINSLQIRGGLGIFYHKDKLESMYDTHIYIIPNIDIILGIQF